MQRVLDAVYAAVLASCRPPRSCIVLNHLYLLHALPALWGQLHRGTAAMFEYWEILPLALALIPGFYLGLPLLIRLQQRFPAEPKLKVLDLERLDRKIAKFLMTRTKALFE